MTSPDIPAAWYPDPAGTGGHRWWDGTAWTTHVRLPEPPPLPPAAPVGTPYVPMARVPYSIPTARKPAVVYTSAAWWLAFSPLWIFAVTFVMGFISLPSLFSAIVSLACVFLSAGLTMHDRKLLLQAGYLTAASTWWWLLTPLAYLLARGVHVSRVKGQGWATAVVYALSISFCIVVQLLIIAALIR